MLKDKIKSYLFRSDRLIWMLVMVFAMISILAIFSSSTFRANTMGVRKTELFFDQIKNVALGFACLGAAYMIPVNWYRKFSITIYAITTFLLAFAIFKGESINGAQRTVEIAGIRFQVLEFAKFGLIFYLATALEKWRGKLDTFRDYCLKILLPVAFTCCLVLVNSASTVVLFGILTILILWFMGVNWRYLLATVGIAIAALALLFGSYYAFKGLGSSIAESGIYNRVESSAHRIESFIEDFKGEAPEPEKMTAAQRQEYYDNIRQSENAKIAISEGGLIGKGIGKGTSRYSLSMAFSDFIFAFIIEESGLLGAIVILLCYGWFLFRSIRISAKCTTPFPQTLVIGISTLITLQAILHIFVNIRLIPITGHTLPLISHGGTAFLAFSASIGVILSISRQINTAAAEQTGSIPAEGESETNE